MSRIHQAIRRAEREERLEPSAKAKIEHHNRNIEYLARELARRPLTEVPHQQHLEQGKPKTFLNAEVESNIDLRPTPRSKLVTVLEPMSFGSNQYRVLKEKLFHVKETKDLKTVLVTSAFSAEGKTVTAANLALAIAQEINQEVLLVDANLRRPSIDSVLGFSSTKGLVDLLRGEIPEEEAILKTRISNFSIVPSGSVPENPTELLNAEGMKHFIGRARECFDWVILDSPPFVPFSDIELISSLVDGILIVVRACQTPANLFYENIQLLEEKNLLGLVLNGVHNRKRAASRKSSRGNGR
jgi:capsular exopolysaccharide synthesis family protein